MENNLIKLETEQLELQTVEEMISGCDSAVVTYGIDQDYNVHKVVTLFVRTSMDVYQFEQFAAEHSHTLAMNPKMALSATKDYKITGKKVRKVHSWEYYKQLYRTLKGFITDSQTTDMRDQYEKRYS